MLDEPNEATAYAEDAYEPARPARAQADEAGLKPAEVTERILAELIQLFERSARSLEKTAHVLNNPEIQRHVDRTRERAEQLRALWKERRLLRGVVDEPF